MESPSILVGYGGLGDWFHSSFSAVTHSQFIWNIGGDMSSIRVWLWVAALLLSSVSYADTIEVDVNGLTCAFCVDSLQRQLKKVPDIEQVDVSLKHKKIRIVFLAESISFEKIKEIIINSGFTPVKIRRVDGES